MKRANGRHVAMHSLQQFNPRVRAEDTALRHPIVIFGAEAMFRGTTHTLELSQSGRHSQTNLGHNLGDVFVAATGQIDNNELARV